jgi:hypothetical protein
MITYREQLDCSCCFVISGVKITDEPFKLPNGGISFPLIVTFRQAVASGT